MKRWRTHFVFALIMLFAAALLSRLVFLQVISHGFYKALAQGQQQLSSLAKGERGDVFLQDKNGGLYTLATNQDASFVFASPLEIEKKEETAAALSEMLGLAQEEIFKKLQKESLYEILKKRISPQEEDMVKQRNISGVYMGKERVRVYPQGDLASHTIGFTNQEGEGQYGIEEYYNALLAGQEGVQNTAKNPASYLLRAFEDTRRDGSDIVLTIDYNIQSMAESLLKKATENLTIEGGTIIVLDPSSGRILALANVPDFNPNEYSEVQDLSIFQNAAIQKLYEPGSVFKPITMAAAIDEKKVTPDTTYEDKGVAQIGGRKIYNYDQRVWGERTMTEVLEYSINTGAVFAEQQLGHEKFLQYIKQFGIFEPTNIDLAGEVFSENKEFQKGYEINFATASFGQGIQITSLQFVRAFSAIANNGIATEPFLVEKRTRNDELASIISPRTASQLTAMLASVVENGFGKAARIPGYYIAGKTGTAEVSWSALGISKSGYSDKTIQSFIGYAPAFDPKFLILVKLDNPQTKTAEYSAIPLFRELAQYIIDYLAIPPDYEVE